MKRIFFSFAFIAASYCLVAQEDTIVSKISTSSNPAYTAPSIITSTFRTTYPDVTDVTWAPMNTWWVANYNRDNRLMRSYYTPGGVTFNLALPVLNGMVPEEVITSAIHVYGNNLYDITRMKGTESMDVYQVRTLDNGIFKTIYIDQTGKVVDYSSMMMNNMNTDMTKDMNMKKDDNKIKTADGTKVKVEDNKTKIKNKNQ